MVVLWIIMSPFVVVGLLKGRYALSIVGLFILFGIPALLASTRLGRADSWWARRYYDEEKLARAEDRYRSGSHLNKALTL